MATKSIVSNSKLERIGNAIRNKTGKTEPLTLDQMANEIENLSADNNSHVCNETAIIEKSLTEYSNKDVRTVAQYAFYMQKELEYIYLPNLESVLANGFASCYSLKYLYIEQAHTICNLGATTCFSNCYHILGTKNSTYNPSSLKDGFIYVPAHLLAQYKKASNWVSIQSQIIGFEDVDEGDEFTHHGTTDFPVCTWYIDRELTTEVSNIHAEKTGRYYCRLGV